MSEATSGSVAPTVRWAEALAGWAIPDHIIEQAPESPWGFPTALFALEATRPQALGPAHAIARAALGEAGSVLDVGCGGGMASIPLAPAATHVTGVDSGRPMLDAFAAAADAANLSHTEVLGRWPDVANLVGQADVVVCSHVVYNVGEIGPFVEALTSKARRLVVVELTDEHPLSGLSPLWQRFWGLKRPVEPTSETFLAVLRELGYEPVVEHSERPPRRTELALGEQVALVRRQLCLTPDRDAEIEVALHELGGGGGSGDAGDGEANVGLTQVSWRPSGYSTGC